MVWRYYLFIVVVLSILLAGCDQKPASKPSTLVSRPVKTITIQKADRARYKAYPGIVSAKQKASLSFEVSGRINKLIGREGMPVKQGELLAELDSRDYKYQLNEAEARYNHAVKTYHRYAELLKTNTVAEAEYDEKKAALEVAVANLETAKKALADTQMFASFNGLIASRYVELHEDVQAKQAIFSLQDMSEVEIKVQVPEQDVAKAATIERITSSEGKEVVAGYVEFPTMPGNKFAIALKEFEIQADSKTKTYTATFLMTPPKESIILPGMTATVNMRFSAGDKDYFLIPLTAATIDPHGNYVAWVVDPETLIVTKTPITVGQIMDDSLQVLSGLNEGDMIVVAGANSLVNGMQITLIKGRIGKDD